ncbi:MAG: tRNA uridine-5-carboxymethylaminomethyl(34) synthesis GTPase MnmE [Acholeplasmatales bacterium]|nr:tRNA uridine-5-carboxymethylaminomethyl(34) synthesis GTPase MnmE [Acholeplasmatales bacterium]
MNDPICAIATPYGVGAISIIRCSGHNTLKLVNNVFKGKDLTLAKANTLNYGYIVDDNQTIDEVMVSVFHAPHCFTGEESCEINCHGGIYNTNRVLECLLAHGFKLAEPGEFSRRAFLNGRIDLTQSEAIMDVISSSNDLALRASVNSLRKSTNKLVVNMRSHLVDLISKIEVNIDYPEYDDAIVMTDEIAIPMLHDLIDECETVLENSKIAVVAIHGIKTAIVGRPNVGKSSLLNRLLEEDKAIVTDIAGTTRDTIEGDLNLGGVTLKLIDTAGIRKSDDVVEQIGIERSKKALEEAELVLLLLEPTDELKDEDKELLKLSEGKKRIIIYNKADLKQRFTPLPDSIIISAKTGDGVEKLEKALIEITRINEFNVNDSNYLNNARHVAKMREALTSLKSALKGCEDHIDIDMMELDVKSAWYSLGEIIGDTNSDTLITELFSRFCLGK